MNIRPLGRGSAFAAVLAFIIPTCLAAPAEAATKISSSVDWVSRPPAPLPARDQLHGVVSTPVITRAMVGQTLSLAMAVDNASMDCAHIAFGYGTSRWIGVTPAVAKCTSAEVVRTVRVTRSMVGHSLTEVSNAAPAADRAAFTQVVTMTLGSGRHTVTSRAKSSARRPVAVPLAQQRGVPTQPITQNGDAMAPMAAAASGFRRLDFSEDFDSGAAVATRDDDTGNHSFYPTLPWTHDAVARASIAHSVLSLDQCAETENMALLSKDPITGAGKSWEHGYFEARMRFDPRRATSVKGWPSLWLMSSNHLDSYSDVGAYGELDIFEAFHEQGQPFNHYFYGTAHQWSGSGGLIDGGNNIASVPGVDWSKWHTFGLLWKRGRAVWYLDGRQVLQQQWAQDSMPMPNYLGLTEGTFSAIDTAGPMTLILGTGRGWNLNVDYVHVWQP